MKTTQNTQLSEIDPIANPNTLTIVDRYFLASHWCKGKTVADYACGKGHGTGILKALGADHVTGFDFEEGTIAENKGRYNTINFETDKLWFECIDVTVNSNDYYDKSFDTVISLETFEHIPQDGVNTYLKNIKKMLKKGGTAIITTPVRRTPEFKYTGGTHLYEYNEEEFRKAISKVFDNFQVDSIGEFRAIENGMLHTELLKGVNENSTLFWCEIKNE